MHHHTVSKANDIYISIVHFPHVLNIHIFYVYYFSYYFITVYLSEKRLDDAGKMHYVCIKVYNMEVAKLVN